jgi:RNA polymerase sigma-70 factor (ECF subfamily)
MKINNSTFKTHFSFGLSAEQHHTNSPPEDFSGFDHLTDRQIWEAFKQGDEAAFNHIYRHNIARLYNFGHQLVRNTALVKDCIQEVFIQICSRRAKLSSVNSIRAYLYKCLYREISHRLEKEGKLQGATLPEEDFAIELSFEEKIISHEIDLSTQQLLAEVMKSLTVRQRKALLLFYEDGLSYLEIAEVMDLKNAKSARKLLYRALDAARQVAQSLFSSIRILLLLGEATLLIA